MLPKIAYFLFRDTYHMKSVIAKSSLKTEHDYFVFYHKLLFKKLSMIIILEDCQLGVTSTGVFNSVSSVQIRDSQPTEGRGYNYYPLDYCVHVNIVAQNIERFLLASSQEESKWVLEQLTSGVRVYLLVSESWSDYHPLEPIFCCHSVKTICSFPF